MPCRIIQKPSEALREKREAKERERVAAEAEQRKQSMQESHRRERELINDRRIAALEAQADALREGYRQARRQQAWQSAIDAFGTWLRPPPPPPEPEIVVIEHHPADDLLFNGFIKRL
jgi:hypothetical protein